MKKICMIFNSRTDTKVLWEFNIRCRVEHGTQFKNRREWRLGIILYCWTESTRPVLQTKTIVPFSKQIKSQAHMQMIL